MNNLKFSIVTPSYNSSKYIDETIKSINKQSYSNYEHIVVDGNSTDDTIEIVKKYKNIVYVSEPDNGQSDAINKGFKLTTGQILAWQNADDLYFGETFHLVAKFFEENPNVGLIYGDYELIDEDGNWICDVHSPKWNNWLFKHGRFCPVQPCVFWRREVYEKIGDLDLSLNFTMDVDFYSRVSKEFTIRHLPAKLGAFRVHNDSKTQNQSNRLKHKAEYKHVLSKNFNYNIFDTIVQELFYQRSRITSLLKKSIFKRI